LQHSQNEIKRRKLRNEELSSFEKIRNGDRPCFFSFVVFRRKLQIVPSARNRVIDFLRSNQGYGSGASHSEETNEIKDPLIAEVLADGACWNEKGCAPRIISDQCSLGNGLKILGHSVQVRRSRARQLGEPN
jgi:hypothetical protein